MDEPHDCDKPWRRSRSEGQVELSRVDGETVRPWKEYKWEGEEQPKDGGEGERLRGSRGMQNQWWRCPPWWVFQLGPTRQCGQNHVKSRNTSIARKPASQPNQGRRPHPTVSVSHLAVFFFSTSLLSLFFFCILFSRNFGFASPRDRDTGFAGVVMD